MAIQMCEGERLALGEERADLAGTAPARRRSTSAIIREPAVVTACPSSPAAIDSRRIG